MSKFYTIPTYSGGALGGLMLGAARGEGDSYDKGWTGLLTGLGTTAGIGGSHYLTKQLEKWDAKLQSNSKAVDELSKQILENDATAHKQTQAIKKRKESMRALDALLKNNDQFVEYAFENGDAAKIDNVKRIFQAASKAGTPLVSTNYNQALLDLVQDTENKIKNKLSDMKIGTDWLQGRIDQTHKHGKELLEKLTSVNDYLNKPMNRLAKKVPLISGLKWLSAIALPAAGFAGAKSLGDYFSSKA